MKKQIKKAKQFIKENPEFIIAASTSVVIGAIGFAVNKHASKPLNPYELDVTDEEWQEFQDAAKLLDERIATRKAERKNK